MNTKTKQGGLGIVSILTMVFIVLKLSGVIKWHWIWVLFANLDFRIDCCCPLCRYSGWRKAKKGQVVICCQEFQNPFRN